MEKTFIKVQSIKDITFSIILIIVGCTMVALPTAASVNAAGFFLALAGLFLVFFLKTAYEEKYSGMKYRRIERYFSQTQRQELIKKISENPDDIDLSGKDKGNAVRLEIYYSKKSGKAYMQLFEYIPYKYEPCSEQIEHDLDALSKIK